MTSWQGVMLLKGYTVELETEQHTAYLPSVLALSEVKKKGPVSTYTSGHHLRY